MNKTLLLLGGGAGALWLLSRPQGAGAGAESTHGRTIPQSQTAASYDAAGHPIPWPIGTVVKIDNRNPPTLATVVAG